MPNNQQNKDENNQQDSSPQKTENESDNKPAFPNLENIRTYAIIPNRKRDEDGDS